MRENRGDNRGFSLVELVIVVAIMAVMGAFFFLGNALLAGQYTRECASDISAALSKEKNYALTKSATIDCYMELTYDTDGFYVRYYQPKNAIATGKDPDSGSYQGDDWVLAEEEKVGKRNVRVVCTMEDGSTVTIGTGHSVKFIYDRISGAFKRAVTSDGSTQGIESDGTMFCTGIRIDGGRTYDITIYSATGKHVLTRVD